MVELFQNGLVALRLHTRELCERFRDKLALSRQDFQDKFKQDGQGKQDEEKDSIIDLLNQ
jgi:hypothetical protein